MAEFISLDEQEQEAPILPDYPHSISNIKPDTKIIDGVIDREEVEGICADYSIISIDKIDSVQIDEEGVEHICIKDDCDVSKYYGCASGDDGFQKENLFSELTDEYQRTLARINLGIADEYALKWGNIKGNLSNQKDLYTFVTDSIAFDINKVIDEINLKLAQWACEIEIRFKNKADIFSPNFAGVPTTTLPLMTDNSNRIASTEWVNAKIAAASIDENVKAISLDPEYMCYGDDPTDVKVTWEYYKEVDEQSINGVSLKPDVREYIFGGTTTSMIVTLKYKYGETNATKIVTFDIKYPIYYGVSPDYSKNKQTIDNSFTVQAGPTESIYVMIPNGINAVLAVSSIIGGFKLLGSQEIFGNIYYIFKSANVGLGETTIEILNQGNFDSDDFDTTSIKELLASKADKYDVYDKNTIDQMFDDFSTGEGGLKNYYTKAEVDDKIPDVSGKADKADIPSKTSQLINDSGFLNEIPSEYITEAELEAKGYLTQELEPAFSASAAKNINQDDISRWNNKVDKEPGKGLSDQNYTIEEKAKLGGLTNYSDVAIKQSIANLEIVVDTKASKADIPDISGKADRSELPTKTSQLVNDSGFLTTLPGGLVTEEELSAKGYLTEFVETDPTVPAWAKQPSKPTYTLEELGAEAAGSAGTALLDARAYTDERFDILLFGADPSYDTFKKLSDAILVQNTTIGGINTEISDIKTTLNTKADKSELFSKDYNDLINTPSIPSIEGLASQTWVQQQIAAIPEIDLSGYALKTDIPDISTKVDKEANMGLSENSYTSSEKAKLASLTNYNDSDVKNRLITLEDWKLELVTFIPKELFLSEDPLTYFESTSTARSFAEELAYSQSVILESSSLNYVPAYNKSGTITTDADGVKTIIVILNFHYDVLQDLKLTIHFVDNETEVTYNQTKEFSVNSGSSAAEQVEAILGRLTTLEKRVDDITLADSIILE